MRCLMQILIYGRSQNFMKAGRITGYEPLMSGAGKTARARRWLVRFLSAIERATGNRVRLY